MDSERLLNFAIEQKLNQDLNESYQCFNRLRNGNINVKDIIETRNLEGLTALCDLLTVMILAMDEYQRLNNKPSVAASNQSGQHTDSHEHGISEKASDGERKDITNISFDTAIDPSEVMYLEEEFKSHREMFPGKA